jgi:hypothetical protein
MSDDEINLENALLFVTDAMGIYIPQIFAKQIKRDCVTGISDEDFAILEAGPDDGPDHGYWETWDDVLNNATITDPDRGEFSLYQDGDLWLVPKPK